METMETMEFAERQPQVTFCNGGRKALVLTGEREEAREVHVPAIEEGLSMQSEVDTEKLTVWVYDGVWLDVAAQTDAAVVAAAKQKVLDAIAEYDKSAAVNSFVLGGKAAWIDKDTRMGLRQNIADKVALGEKDITMWMQGTPITLPCATAERLMCGLENYAYECYNVTAAHKKAVEGLATVEEIMGYDYTGGYPEKIRIEV